LDGRGEIEESLPLILFPEDGFPAGGQLGSARGGTEQVLDGVSVSVCLSSTSKRRLFASRLQQAVDESSAHTSDGSDDCASQTNESSVHG
jgi:hypothetical protein